MDKDRTSLERIALLATGVVTAVAGLFAALNGLYDKFRSSIEILAGFEKWQLGAAAVALLAFGIWLIRVSRRRRSLLLRPEALRLERDNPAHLFGRADDIEQLARLCREEGLVFLEGESGTGKSALLQAGLVPALRNHPGLLPIYVESFVGPDWERDPRTFLATALWSSLDEASREALDLKAAPRANDLRNVLEAISPNLGRTPLLLLDQFDDYQLRHHERFLFRRTWLKPGKLSEQNTFWRDIRELLANRTIHVVVVTRTDTAAGLTSVRFTEPEIYRLDRLSSHFIGPLIGELTKDRDGGAVIADPDYGWKPLLARVSADLERSGTILPQQLKIVLAGLGTLPGRILTVTAYERVGATSGLEARFIEDRIAKAARLHAKAEERVRAALLALVDPISGQKTVERPVQELLCCIDPAAPERAQPVLDLLVREEVIRWRVDSGTGERYWLLDHDYLARAVREAERRANRWQRALAEGAKALADAGASWPRRWRALLPPKTQLDFFLDRLRGRFRYGGYRSYAAKSLQRFFPAMGILLLLGTAGFYELERRAEDGIARSANDVLNGLEFPESQVSERDGAALLCLASAEVAVRQRALRLVLTDRDRAYIFIRQPDIVVRALAGVSPRFRDQAKAPLADAVAALGLSRPETLTAIADASRLLRRSEAASASWCVAGVKSTTEPNALKSLAGQVGSLPTELTDSQVTDVLGSFLAAIQNGAVAGDSTVLQTLQKGMTILMPKLSVNQARDSLGLFIDTIKNTRYTGITRVLREQLITLTARLSHAQARETVYPLLAALKDADAWVLPDLGAVLASLRIQLTDAEIKEAVDSFVSAINRAAEPYLLRDLGVGLGKLPGKLTDNQFKDATRSFLLRIEGTTDREDLAALAEGLRAFAGKLTDRQSTDALAQLLAAIEGTTDSHALGAFGLGVGALQAKLGEDQGSEVTTRFLAALGSTTDPDALKALGQGLGALPVRLTDAQAKQALAPFLTYLKGTRDLNDPQNQVSEGLMPLLSRFIASQAAEAADALIAALRGTENTAVLEALGKLLGALPGNLSDSQVAMAVELFAAAINRPSNINYLDQLDRGLAELSPKLTNTQARHAAELLLAAVSGVKYSNQLSSLGKGLGKLPTELDVAQAKEVLGPFIDVIEGTNDSAALRVIGSGLAAFAAKLDVSSAETARIAANAVLEKTSDRDVFDIYVGIITNLKDDQPSGEKIKRIFHLIRNPLSAYDPSQEQMGNPDTIVDPTKRLLTLLEHVPGIQAEFGGDPWKAVAWAEAELKAGRLKGLDLDAPLEIP